MIGCVLIFYAGVCFRFARCFAAGIPAESTSIIHIYSRGFLTDVDVWCHLAFCITTNETLGNLAALL